MDFDQAKSLIEHDKSLFLPFQDEDSNWRVAYWVPAHNCVCRSNPLTFKQATLIAQRSAARETIQCLN
jgi:hypothetical protein